VIRIAASSLVALVIITVAVLGWRGRRSPEPPFQPFMDMVAQPRYDPQSESQFFTDRRTQRPPTPRAVAWGRGQQGPEAPYAQQDEELFSVQTMPMAIDRELLNQGQKLYQIFCTVCHGGTGAGNGITTQYAMNAPPSYHTDRLRQIADGEIYKVVTQGKGQMGPYGDRIKPPDRWAIVAYVRALQRAYSGSADEVPAHIRQAMPANAPAATADSTSRARSDALVDQSATDPVSAGETK
jgi:mono/diheme cytochrome c family protein